MRDNGLHNIDEDVTIKYCQDICPDRFKRKNSDWIKNRVL